MQNASSILGIIQNLHSTFGGEADLNNTNLGGLKIVILYPKTANFPRNQIF